MIALGSDYLLFELANGGVGPGPAGRGARVRFRIVFLPAYPGGIASLPGQRAARASVARVARMRQTTDGRSTLVLPLPRFGGSDCGLPAGLFERRASER